MYTYEDIKCYIKVNGWIRFLTLPLRRIQLKLFVIDRGILYYFSPENISQRKSDPSIILKRATVDDFDKLKEINPNTALFREFLKNNEIFVIAIIDKKVVGHLSIAKNVPNMYKNLICLKQEEAIVREGFILPEYRNMGIYSMLFPFASKIAEKEGYSKIFGIIISNNHKSIEIHTKKFGFIPVFRYTYVKLLSFEKIWVNGSHN